MFIRSFYLTDMCLNIIVKNLELIVVNEKNIPKIFVDFLLKLYAGKIFYDYRKLKPIEEDVMLWFLNRHAKEVTLPKKLFSERIIKKLRSIGTGITSLNLHRSAAPEDVLNAIIRCVPNVKYLDLSHTRCSGSTLSVIQEVCQNLESLNLRSCDHLTDECMKKLCGENKSLKILDMTDCYTGYCYGPLIALNGMPWLECVKCHYLTDLLMTENINVHKKLHLTELVCEMYSDYGDIIEILTKMCPKIRKLHFGYPVGERDLQDCTEFKELEELKLTGPHLCLREYNSRHNSNIRPDYLSPILPISGNLKTLILSSLQIPTVMLVENFRNLEKLYLKNVSFTSFKEEDIKCTDNRLKTLVIKDIDMKVSSTTYQAIILLITLSKNVTELDLSYNAELPSGLFDAILNSTKRLSSVSFYHTYVKMGLLLPFFDIPSLKMIIANHYEDDDEDFPKHKLMPKLSSTLSWCYMSDGDSDGEIHFLEKHYDSDSTDHDSMDDYVISDYCNST